MDINKKIQGLRDLMKKDGISAYIIPSSDSHQSEYVSEHFRAREWISGFTGSAGTVVITKERAILWADGRYYIQAERQISGTEYELFKMGQPGVPGFLEFLGENLKPNDTVGFDGSVISITQLEKMKKEFKKNSINIDSTKDYISELWKDRPDMPKGKLFIHDIEYVGKTASEKLKDIRGKMRESEADYYVISSLDDIAWTLNLRGNDIPNNPVFTSYLIIDMNGAALFIDEDKCEESVIASMNEAGVTISGYDEVVRVLSKIKEGTIIYDPDKTSVKILSSMGEGLKRVEKRNITTDLKAIKNHVEIANFMNCAIRDGVAMVKFIKYLKENIGRERITEISASDYLEGLRSGGENYVELSFGTIAAYKEHAAMMHYSATPETDYELKEEGLFLVDSGAQYLDGTTDITRTIVLGDITDEEKRDFTLVVKANIDLAMARFLYGTTGSNLDILARMPLWKEGIDYKCGTGHGVGYLLNVHEGPQRLSQVNSDVKLEPGMNITDEPGIYKEGKHGIRIENMLLVVDDRETEYGGRFLRFDVATFCPIDLSGIDVSMLNEEQRDYLNRYHNIVRALLSPYLNEDEKIFLEKETRAI